MIYRASRRTFPRPYHLKMLRFFEKHFRKSRKSSTNQVPLKSPTHRIIGTGAECGRDSDGEYRLRKISELMKPMGLIKPWRQISTTEGVLAPQLRTGGPDINSFLRRMPQP